MANARNAKGKRGRSGTKKISGVDFTWDPNLDDNKPAPAPLFPVSQSPIPCRAPPFYTLPILD